MAVARRPNGGVAESGTWQGYRPDCQNRAMALKLSAPSLLVLVGASGSGKSTWAAEHFANTEIISSDSLRALVGAGEYDQSASAAAFDVLERIVDVCSGVATMSGTTITPEFRHAIPSVVNDRRLTAALEQASVAVLGSDYVSPIEQPSLGGEDFAFYLQHVPGAMLRLGCASPGVAPQYLHSPRFDIDERCLPLGSRILLRAAAGAPDV